MKITCVQFDSRLGDVNGNIQKTDKLLGGVSPKDLDLLVLPELAFTGACITPLITLV